MIRLAIAALLVLAALAPAPADAQASRSLVVNIHAATPLGCGNYGSGPHYSYRVFVDGTQVASSTVRDPVEGVVTFDELVLADLGTSASAQVGFEVVDHANNFLFGESQTPCNVTGTQTRATILYTLGQPQLVRVSGSSQGAALEAYVSDSTLPVPQEPTLSLSGSPSASEADFAYDAHAIPGLSRAELADAGGGSAVATASTPTGSLAWTGLAENSHRSAHLVARGGSWIVASNVVSFVTANAPPPAPALTFLRSNATSATFDYRNAPADIASLDVYLGTSASFAPGPANLATTATGGGFVTLDGLQRATRYWVVARATDQSGATNDSAPIAFATEGASVEPVPAFSTPAPAATPTPGPTDPADPLGSSVVSALDAASGRLLVAPGGHASVLVRFTNLGSTPMQLVARDRYAALLSQPSFSLAVGASLVMPVDVDLPADAPRGQDIVAFQDIDVRAGGVVAGTHRMEIPVRVASEAASVGGLGSATGWLALLVVAAAGGIVAALLLLLRRDATRYAVAVALYARLAKSRVLDHPAREALHARIAQQPGVTYTELLRATGLATGALVHHLQALERAGLVASRKEGAFRRFYAAGSAPRAENARVEALTPAQARVLELLREAPRTQGELAQVLGVSQQAASQHVKALERGGHVEAFHDGQAWRYRPVATFEIVP